MTVSTILLVPNSSTPTFPNQALFDAWKRADDAAKVAEKLLRDALDAYAAGGAAPEESVVNSAKKMRTEAIALLDSYIKSSARGD